MEKVKGGSFTIGHNAEIYGGILIRSIQDLSTYEIIEEFIGKKEIPLHINDVLLKLTKNNEPHIEKIYSGPRIGLTLKYNRKDIIEYLMKDY